MDARNVSNLKHFNYYSRKGQTGQTSKQQADLASRISLTSDFSLSIERLSIEDSGFYRCRVDFRYSRTLNTLAKLSVIGKGFLLLENKQFRRKLLFFCLTF